MAQQYPVLVTGGAGCLGQHIIKFLHTHATHVTEIRILDVIPYQKKLDYEERVPVVSVTGDISDITDTTPFRNVKAVFHLAAIVSVTNFPDTVAMERVNVKGTEQVLKACLRENVERLVFVSTVDVVCGFSSIVDGTEESVIAASPGALLYEGYAGTKLQAEKLVLEHNGKQSSAGVSLNTISLRPNVFFGELDTIYIPTVLRRARDNKGIFTQVGDGTALYQHAYVGNVAWAFICAEKTLKQEADLTHKSTSVNDGSALDNIDSCSSEGNQNDCEDPVEEIDELKKIISTSSVTNLGEKSPESNPKVSTDASVTSVSQSPGGFPKASNDTEVSVDTRSSEECPKASNDTSVTIDTRSTDGCPKASNNTSVSVDTRSPEGCPNASTSVTSVSKSPEGCPKASTSVTSVSESQGRSPKTSVTSVAGEVFFITDDAPPQSMAKQVLPFLEAVGCVLSSYKLPYSLIYGSVRLTQGLLWMFSPLKKINLGFSAMSIRYINTTFTFNSDKARKHLGYVPPFSPEEAIKASNSYYSTLFTGDDSM